LIPKPELDYLQDLLRDFPTSESFTPEKAFSIIKVRYAQLEKSDLIPKICQKLKSVNKGQFPILNNITFSTISLIGMPLANALFF